LRRPAPLLLALLAVLGTALLGSGCAAKKRAAAEQALREVLDPGAPVRALDDQRAALKAACRGGWRPACELDQHLLDTGWALDPLGDALAARCVARSGPRQDDLACTISGAALMATETPGQGQRLLELGCIGGEDLACTILAENRRRGRGLPRDPAAAGAALSALCADGEGLPRACRSAAQMHAVGDGLPRDLDRAALLADLACATGDAAACAELGWLRLQTGAPEAAVAPLDAACAGGVKAACAERARLPGAAPGLAEAAAAMPCAPGDVLSCPLAPSPLDPAAAELACAKGDAAACTRLGLAQLRGELPWSSFRSGASAFNTACALGHVPGCTWEGRIFDYWGAEQRRVRWLFPHACARGEPDACVEADRRLLPDPAEQAAAGARLSAACAAGVADACAAVAEGVLQGHLPGDKRQAVSELQAACAAGGRFGCGTLGGAVLDHQPELGSALLLVGCGHLERGSCAALVAHHGVDTAPPGLADTGWDALFAQTCELGADGVCSAWARARATGISVPVDRRGAQVTLREGCAAGDPTACQLAEVNGAALTRPRRTFGEHEVPQLAFIDASPALPAESLAALDAARADGDACARGPLRRGELAPRKITVRRTPDGRSEALVRGLDLPAFTDCVADLAAKVPVTRETELRFYAGWGAPPDLRPPADTEGIYKALRFGPGQPAWVGRPDARGADLTERRLGESLLAAIPFADLVAECPLLGEGERPVWPVGALVLRVGWSADGELTAARVISGPEIPALRSCVEQAVLGGGFFLGRPGVGADIELDVPLEFTPVRGGPVQVGGVRMGPGTPVKP